MPGAESQPSCAFTTGVLSNFLTLAAGGPVAVLEVTCSSRGDDMCGFAFGSGNTIANFIPVGNYLSMLDEARSL